MADRVSAQITIGGIIAASALQGLIAAIQDEGLSTEYDGEPVQPGGLVSGEALTLCAHEVAWGTFRNLEAFCRTHHLAYCRWFGACSGAWGSGRSIYRGADETRKGEEGVDEYDASDDDQTLMGEQLARHLGSYEAIVAHFARANFAVPPLEIAGATDCARTDATAVPA